MATAMEGKMDDDRPVLICYDGSNESHRAIPAAAALLAPRRAVVVDVGPTLTPGQSYAEVFAPVIANFAEENAELALDRAKEGVAQAHRAGFEAVAHGEVAETTWEGIVEYADQLDAAVIVVGSHGWSAGGEFLHGSVSHQVAVHARRPVLIVPPPSG
jgi:nucleotide-binding universal stress UspA family protein